MKKLTVPVIVGLSLAACSTTSVTDADRALPTSSSPSSEVALPVSSASSEMDLVIKGDTTQSLVTFIGKKAGVLTHEGKFTDVKFMMTLDSITPSDLTKATINATIAIDSIVTDTDGLTKHLLSADFFDSAVFPTAEFVSTKIALVSGNTFTITGNLTMHGVTKEISFKADITDTYVSAMDVTIDRTEFGVGGSPDDIKGVDAKIPMTIKIIFAN